MSNELKRTLSLPDSISIVAGSMIGCGIFLVSADISRQVQSSWLVLLVWMLAGLISICGAIAYGELASNIPDEGGQYMYLKKIFNDKVAFLFGWTLFLVIQSGSIAAICVAFSKFTGLLIPFINSHHILWQLGPIHFTTQNIFGLLTVLLLTYINSRGVEQGMVVQNLFTVTKLLSMVGIILCGLFFGIHWGAISSHLINVIHSHGFSNVVVLSATKVGAWFPALSLANLTGFLGVGIKVLTATVGALFATITWNNVTFIAGEIIEPEKNVKKALAYGVGLVIVLYLLINLVYITSLSLSQIQNAPEDIVAAAAMGSMFGDVGRFITALIIMVSAFGCANGMIMTGARVYYKMAKDRLFFRKMAYINRRTKVPENSLWGQFAWISLLIIWGNYTQILDFVIFASLIFYIITMIGIFIYRKQNPDSNPKFKVHSAYAIVFITLATAIVVCLAVNKPTYTLPGFLITLAGLPVYWMWNKSRNKAHLDRMNAAIKKVEAETSANIS